MIKETIKEKFNLDYENNEIKSGLIKWYNNLLNKSPCELNAVDVSKMIRQDIIKDFALDILIDLIITNPFDGEMYDGDLLNLIISEGIEEIRNKKGFNDLVLRLDGIDDEINEFDWITEKDKELFKVNLRYLIKAVGEF